MPRPVILSILIVLLCTCRVDGQSISVGPNVQVSVKMPSDPHFEMQLAADPENANRLAACSMVWPSEEVTSDVVTYVSLDGGRTWSPTLRTRGERDRPSWDPACAYGPGGILYVVSENIDSVVSAAGAYERLDRSTDGGRTWDPVPVRFKHGERTFLSVDRSRGPRRGWLYFYGSGVNCPAGVKCRNPRAIFLRASGDSGRTIVEENFIPASNGEYPIGYGPGTVLSNGVLVAPIGSWSNYYNPDGSVQGPTLPKRGHDVDRGNGVMRVFTSEHDRANWPPRIQVDSISDWYIERKSNSSWLTSLAADASEGLFRDRIYIVWPDTRSGRTEFYLAFSADTGKTWSRPRTINDDPPGMPGVSGRDALHGNVAVNKDGVIGVMWFDRRDNPDNLGYTVRFRASLDGGETFGPSVKVSDIPYDPGRTNPVPLWESGGWGGVDETINLGVHQFNFSVGHTVGFTADAAGVFHALWVGNQTRVPQLWTAPISVTGTVARNGADYLSMLTDVSTKVRIMTTNRRWNRNSGSVDADIVLENISRDTIRAPLKVRLLTLRSADGEVKVVAADNGVTAEGAVWDVTSLAENGALAPGQRTRPRHIQFHITGAVMRTSTDPVIGFAIFDAKVLAGSTKIEHSP